MGYFYSLEDVALKMLIHRLYKYQSHKLSMQKFIQNEGKPIQLTVNGIIHTFKFNQVMIVPKAVGATYTRVMDFTPHHNSQSNNELTSDEIDLIYIDSIKISN